MPSKTVKSAQTKSLKEFKAAYEKIQEAQDAVTKALRHTDPMIRNTWGARCKRALKYLQVAERSLPSLVGVRPPKSKADA